MGSSSSRSRTRAATAAEPPPAYMAESGTGMWSEYDPLIVRADKQIEKEKERQRRLRQLGMTVFEAVVKFFIAWLLPLAVFTATAFSVALLYFSNSGWLALIMVVLLLAGSLVLSNAVGYKFRLGELIMLAIFCGVLCGFWCYYRTFVYYFYYQDMRTYTNVAASQPGKAHKDASMIMFTQDTLVDISRALGFEAPENSDTYCVAPVVDAGMTSGDQIQYWAVGKNCCLPRGSFDCANAKDASARSALLVLEPEWLAPGWMTWLLPSAEDREAYARAIELNEAAFGTETAPRGDRRLLRWAKDPTGQLAAIYNEGENLVGLFVLAYAAVSSILAAVSVYFWREGPMK